MERKEAGKLVEDPSSHKEEPFLSVSKAKKGYKDSEMPSEGSEWGAVPQPSFRDVSNTIKENPGPGGKP